MNCADLETNGVDFTIRKGALLPYLDAIVKDSDGNAVNLSGAQSIIFAMRPISTRTVITGAAEIVDEEAGEVRYAWNTGDTNTQGYMDCVFRVQFSNGYMTFPSNDYLIVNVTDNLL